MMKFRMMFVMAVVLLMGALAHADSLTISNANNNCTGSNCNGFAFTGTVDPAGPANHWTVTFTIANTNQSIQAYVQGFSMTLFTAPLTVNSITATPNISPITITTANNSAWNNGNSNCQGGGNQTGWLCADLSSGYLLTAGSSLKFTMDITTTGSMLATSSWHFQSNGTDCALGSGPRCGNTYAISQSGNGTTLLSEPGSLSLLGVSLFGMGTFLRRRLR